MRNSKRRVKGVEIAAHGMQNQKVPSRVGFTLIQANVGTETSHCCFMKDLSPKIWAHYPE